MQINVGGQMVDIHPLKKPIGSFTHWYMLDGEPRYLVVRADQAGENFLGDPALSDALHEAMVTGRYLIAVFTVDSDEVGNQILRLQRTSQEFPFNFFERAKSEFTKNLDSEFKPPEPLKMAEFVPGGSAVGSPNLPPNAIKSPPGQMMPGSQNIAAAGRPVAQVANPAQSQGAIAEKLAAMNQKAEAVAADKEQPPKANVVSE